jgi:hypothetical protein
MALHETPEALAGGGFNFYLGALSIALGTPPPFETVCKTQPLIHPNLQVGDRRAVD